MENENTGAILAELDSLVTRQKELVESMAQDDAATLHQLDDAKRDVDAAIVEIKKSEAEMDELEQVNQPILDSVILEGIKSSTEE